MTEHDDTRAIDPAAIQQLLDMTGGDAAFLDELLDAFLEGAQQQLSEMHRAAAEHVAGDLVRPAHSLKGNAANVGARRLEALGRDLERAARAGAVADVGARIAAIAAELVAVQVDLATYRRGS